ncbi:hypothetical protein ACP70R_041485 [Stipagrostis hirtigluma subsp. patula]
MSRHTERKVGRLSDMLAQGPLTTLSPSQRPTPPQPAVSVGESVAPALRSPFVPIPLLVRQCEPPAMEPEATTPHAKKRRTQVSERREQEEMASLSPHNQEPPPATDAPRPVPTSHGQEPRHRAGAEGEDGADRISGLPDAILGEIISLLPTKDGARTSRTLASRWRHFWLAAPLNLDVSLIPAANQDALAGVISRILAAHPGPARRFSVPALHLHRRRATVAAWLRSPALDNLQELEFDVGEIPNRRAPQLSLVTRPMQTLPASAFRFSSTLRVLTISKCHLLDNLVETLNFPQLRLLGLEGVQISDGGSSPAALS